MVPEMKEVTNLFHKVSVWVHLTSSRQTPSKVSHTSFGLPGYSITTTTKSAEQKKDRREQRNSCSAKVPVDKAVPIKMIPIRFLATFWLFSSSYLRNASILDSTNRCYYDYGTCVFKLSIDPRSN